MPDEITITQLLQLGTQRLREHGTPNAKLDSEVLLAHLLKIDRLQLFLIDNRQVCKPNTITQFEQLIQKRCHGTPIAYLIGKKEFFSLDFIITPAVLIPRADTEVLVERVGEELQTKSTENISICDVGTGSAAIACALATVLPNASILASDISREALKLAAQNIALHQLESQISCIQMDILQAIKPNSLDVVVSNPPYIANSEDLPEEVAKEPAKALRSGEDGLDHIRMLIQQSSACLKPHGLLAFEHAFNQGLACRKLLEQAGCYDAIQSCRDLACHERVSLAYKRAS